MLRQLWRWLKRFFTHLFAKKRAVSSISSEQSYAKRPQQLTDAEYESKFLQLLSGIESGWSQGKVQGFLDVNNINQDGLIAWLQRFGDRLLASDGLHNELGQRMVQLGQLGCGELGEIARDIGMRLLTRGEEAKETDVSESEADAWLYRGFEEYKVGDFESAIASFDKAVEIKPDFYQAWYNRGFALGQSRRLTEAIASWNKVVEIKPDHHEAWCNQGFALGQLGRLTEAVASYDKAVEIKPDYHEAWSNRGLTLYQLGKLNEAIASWDKVVEIEPNDHKTWRNRGFALYQVGRLALAVTSFDKALEIKPNDDKAWINRGLALDQLGKLESAIASFDKAIEIKPDFYEAWINRGLALRKLGRFTDAIASFDTAIEIKPDFHFAWTNRGLALDNLGRLEEAVASYDQALEIKPDDNKTWNSRGMTLLRHLRLEEAIASFDKAVEIKPDDHEAWVNRGLALYRLVRLEQAIASFDNALEIKPDIPSAWYNRGIAAGKSIACDESLAFSSTVARLNPTLNQRGYSGELASYQLGLKYCHQDTHPEGWAKLHHGIGKAHYFQGIGKPNCHEYWSQAEAEYSQALITLTPEAFPELYLELVQDFIRVLIRLGKEDSAKQQRQNGLKVFGELLNSPKNSPQQKRQLEANFWLFSQMRVDALVENGDRVTAIEVAERNKNLSLSSILDPQNGNILSPSYSDIQKLINPTQALVYWHLSPFVLTAFIIKPGEDKPAIISAPSVSQLETWIDRWDKQYQNYRDRKKTDSSITNKPSADENIPDWRLNLPDLLLSLSDILNIPTILQSLNNINQLILIPHRDLHRFPLHALFPSYFSITYLPSAQIGISVQHNADITNWNQQPLLSVKYPDSKDFDLLPYTGIESAAITRFFYNFNIHSIFGNEASKTAVMSALKAGYSIFHFTGYASYDSKSPKQSALYLSGEDYLTLAEICSINLNSVNLVNLCACETAIVGSSTIKNEYVGLVSAFLYQDVSYVISSLWTVNEVSSCLLMIYFYNQLNKGSSTAYALYKATNWLRNMTERKLLRMYQVILDILEKDEKPLRYFLIKEIRRISQLELSQRNRKCFDDPYHWAAFTVTGKTSY